MMQRRSLLKTLAAAGAYACVPPAAFAAAAPGKIRVTLVRWPYT